MPTTYMDHSDRQRTVVYDITSSMAHHGLASVAVPRSPRNCLDVPSRVRLRAYEKARASKSVNINIRYYTRFILLYYTMLD